MAHRGTLLLCCWCMAATLCQQAAYARIRPTRAYVASTGAKPSKEAEAQVDWSIGDILVASHNDVGFPRVDVLDPNTLSVKDSVDLVPACGGQSRTRGLSFSPRFSKTKLQLAVSCAAQQSQVPDGKVVLLAAKQAHHPVLETIAVQQPGASVYNRSGEIYVFGAQPQPQQQSAVSTASVIKPQSAPALGDAQLRNQSQPQMGNTTAAAQPNTTVTIAAAAAPSKVPQQQSVLFKLATTASTGAAPGQQGQAGTVAIAAAAAPAGHRSEVAAVLPSWVTKTAKDISLDLGANGHKVFYTLGNNMLRTYDTVAGIHLSDRQLPASDCSALLAQFDGTLLVACARCLYHLPASAAVPPIRHACFNTSAPFGQHMAMDPTGTHVLVSAADGSVHSIRVSDFTAAKQTSLPGRTIGGLAVLGTVVTNQQDCMPGTGCCPYGKILSKGTTCRKPGAECAEEAQCDGKSPECPADHPVKTLGTICRHPRQPCEQAAICDGLTDKCPPNPVMVNGTECTHGRADNPCTARGLCDGVSTECKVPAAQKNGEVCAWRPDEDLNIFRNTKAAARTASLTSLSPSLQQAAVGALRSLVRRSGRRPLAEQSSTSAAVAAWGGGSRASPLSVCQGQCMESKCVMSVSKRGCCILPGSRLDEDAPGSQPDTGKRKHKRRRGTEEDMYCWE